MEEAIKAAGGRRKMEDGEGQLRSEGDGGGRMKPQMKMEKDRGRRTTEKAAENRKRLEKDRGGWESEKS